MQNLGNKRALCKCGNKFAQLMGEAELASSVVAKAVAKQQVRACVGASIAASTLEL